MGELDCLGAGRCDRPDRVPLTAAVLHLPFDLALTAAAYAIEGLFGYPASVFRVLRHPVVWFGALIGALDRGLNHGPARARRVGGIVAVTVLIGTVGGVAAMLQSALGGGLGLALLAIVGSAFPAQRSLAQHVGAVAERLERDGLAGGRAAVSHIVGRDPATLDEAAVLRAAIESLAENFSDGVVAPAVWGALAGLPGMAGYKAINTADSMIGHRTPRHEAFGWAAARLDDLVNLPASRLAAVWLMLAAAIGGGDARAAARAVRRDAGRHRSPNAGWPEAAMAGALGLRLAGPRTYAGVTVADGWMGNGRAEATVADLRAALKLYRVACGLQFGALLLAAALTWRG